MEEELSKLYYDPNTGYGDYRSLWIRSNKKYTQNAIKNWLQKQEINQVFKQVKPKDKPFKKIIAHTAYSYQMDITFYEALKRQNAGYIGILTLIEITSKKGYGYPIKSKKTNEIDRAFKQFMKDTENKATTITSDNEASFKSIIRQYPNIKHFTADENKRITSVVERFNRTLRELITKYQKANKTKDWVKALPSLLKNYNTKIHSATKKKPSDFTKKGIEARIVEQRIMEASQKLGIQYEIGQRVRVLKKKTQFQKGAERYTKGIYTIAKIENNHFILRNPKNQLLQRRYTRADIQKVEEIQESTYKIEKQEQSGKQIKKVNRTIRRNKREGLQVDEEGNLNLHRALKPKTSKRERKVVKRYS